MRTFACVLGEHITPVTNPAQPCALSSSELRISDRNKTKILIGAWPKTGSDMRVIRGGVGLGMGLTPLLPPNFLVSNGATSYPHLLSPHRKATRLSTPNPSPKGLPSNWPH